MVQIVIQIITNDGFDFKLITKMKKERYEVKGFTPYLKTSLMKKGYMETQVRNMVVNVKEIESYE